MADRFAGKLPLRHRAETPMFISMVILNLAILGTLIDFLATANLVAPALMVVRQVQRASIRGTAVQLSRTQFPDLYASVDDFAATLGVRPTPRISQLPRSHPWTVRRIWRLHQLGLFGAADLGEAPQPEEVALASTNRARSPGRSSRMSPGTPARIGRAGPSG